MGTVPTDGALYGDQTLASEYLASIEFRGYSCRILRGGAYGSVHRKVMHATAECAEECSIVGVSGDIYGDAMSCPIEVSGISTGRGAYHERGEGCEVDIGNECSISLHQSIVHLMGKVHQLLWSAYLEVQVFSLSAVAVHSVVYPGYTALHKLSEPLHLPLIRTGSPWVDLYHGGEDGPAHEVESL